MQAVPFLALFFAGLGLLGASAAVAQSNAEDVLSIVTSCDLLGAHPDDPLRVAPGVADEELVPRLVVRACEPALQGESDVARHAFQLGRAKLELGQRAEAIELFERAGRAGSAIAYLFIGDAHHFGWVGTPDPKAAMEAYATARNLGLVIAEVAINQLEFRPDLFTTGPMLEVLYTGKISLAIDFAGSKEASAYLYAFAVELSERCGSFLRPEAVEALQDYRFPPGWSAASEEGVQKLGVQDVKATYDVEVLVDRHGCSGIVVQNIADSFNDMVVALAER